MRIRTIKPEFWTSDDITSLPIFTRLFFIGLWSYVDDNGVGQDEEHLIASRLFPRDLYDSFQECSGNVRGSLRTLSEAGLIVRYEDNGRRFFQIINWKKHQRIDKPQPGRFPQYDAEKHHSRNVPGMLPEDSTPGTEEQRNRGTGEYPPNPPHTGGTEDEHQDTTFELIPTPTTDPGFDEFWATYPRREGKDQARKAWRKAVKRAKPAEIIAGAARYRDDPNRDPAYTKHPGPWLNAGRWADDPLPQRPGKRSARDTTSDRVQGWLALGQQLAQDPRKEIQA